MTDGALVIATIDDTKQNTYMFEKVGEIMVKVKRMMETDENGVERQFYPITYPLFED